MIVPKLQQWNKQQNKKIDVFQVTEGIEDLITQRKNKCRQGSKRNDRDDSAPIAAPERTAFGSHTDSLYTEVI